MWSRRFWVFSPFRFLCFFTLSPVHSWWITLVRKANSSCFSLVFRAFQYFRGRGLPVSISITSMIEKNHFCFSSSQCVLTFCCSNSFTLLVILLIINLWQLNYEC